MLIGSINQRNSMRNISKKKVQIVEMFYKSTIMRWIVARHWNLQNLNVNKQNCAEDLNKNGVYS